MEFLLILAEKESRIATTLTLLQSRFETALLETGDPVDTIVGIGDPKAILYFSSFSPAFSENLSQLRKLYRKTPILFVHDQDFRLKSKIELEEYADSVLVTPPPPTLLLDILKNLSDKFSGEKSGFKNLPSSQKVDFIEKNTSPAMQRAIRIVRKVSPTDATILITGESGTGKEVTAHWIHNHSPRKQKPFIAINCGAITETILESELFGHKKGAFTGAEKDKTGLFEAAHNGTVFLDEIGEMPLNLQVKLLRVLQERKVRKVGDIEDISVNVRIIAATNKNLKMEVSSGRFREDLYYRLGVIPLHLPPLRERKEELPGLIRDFFLSLCQKHNRNLSQIAPSTMNILMNLDYPGNIRELQNIMEYAVIMCESTTLQPQDLPFELQKDAPHNLLPAPDHIPISLPQTLHDFLKIFFQGQLPTIEQVEKILIQERMEMFLENQKQVADSLGISRTSLWRKLKEFEDSEYKKSF